jgi:flagellar biosynthesis component FlhA
LLSAVLFGVWQLVKNSDQEKVENTAKDEKAAEKKPDDKVEDMLAGDRLGVEIGYRLIPLVDKDRGGTMLDRITTLRKQLARELGMLIPPIRIKDNIQLSPTAYRVLLHGQPMTKGELWPSMAAESARRFLALRPKNRPSALMRCGSNHRAVRKPKPLVIPSPIRPRCLSLI